MNSTRAIRSCLAIQCLCYCLVGLGVGRRAAAQPVICPIPATEPPICQDLQTSQCANGVPGAECYPLKVQFVPGTIADLQAVECSCELLFDQCGPISVLDNEIRCPGPCPVPPGGPCEVIVTIPGQPSMSTGGPSVIFTDFPIDTQFECGCGGGEPQGACCFEDGSCNTVPASQCQGLYAGDGTACAGLAACCFDSDGDGIDDACLDVDMTCCGPLFGGAFLPVGTACSGTTVPCCLQGGAICIVADDTCCSAQGGVIAIQGVCLGDNNGDMIDDGCQDLPPGECVPTADLLGCATVPCPVPGQECVVRCVRRVGGVTFVDACECRDTSACPIDFDPVSGSFTCGGVCPPGFHCESISSIDPITGDTIICCDCVPDQIETGACCDVNGVCIVVPATQCAGIFLGPGTTCLGDVPCCFEDGSCLVMDERCCTALSGFIAPQGACMGDNNGNMIDDGCEEPQQVCPLDDTQPPFCINLQTSQCLSNDPNATCLPRRITITAGGGPVADECRCFKPGDGCGAIIVDANSIAHCAGACPVPPNDPNDQCLVIVNGDPLTAAPSVDLSNLPAGSVVECSCTGGMPVEGACCLEDGTCAVVPPNQCEGAYAGDGTNCLGVGACCYDSNNDGLNNECVVVDGICCDLLYTGTFQGVNTVCLGKGACCFDLPGIPGTQCTVLDRICCDDIGGTFLGLGTICLGDVNGDGSDDACVPVECGPAPDHLSCTPVQCPVPGQECLPRCVLERTDGTIEIIDCDCVSPNECHLEWMPGTSPVCVGDCPPGFTCVRRIIPTPLGTQICCECLPDPLNCEPTDDFTDCKPFICPNPDAETCRPRCVRITPNGQILVTDCDCRADNECFVNINVAPGDLPACIGGCPPGQVCVENANILADGSVELCCDCQPIECECPGDVNGDGVLNGLDIAPFIRCLLGVSLPIDNCACADVDEDGDVDFADVQALVTAILTKVPCPKDPPCPPEDLLINLGTGVDANGNLIPVGSPDDTWNVLAEPPPVGILPRPATVINPHPAWLTIPGTRWVSAQQQGPNGKYVYETCFCLSNQAENPVLDLLVRADDVADIFLNGNYLGTTPPVSFNIPVPFHVVANTPGLFHEGENCVRIEVRNTHGVVTGLDVGGTVHAENGKCCCPLEDLSRDVASGVNDGGGLIPTGADDDTWVVTVDPSGGIVPRPATVINAHPAWLTIPGTKWIAAAVTGPNGAYTYEYCFCLDKYFEKAKVILDLRADDTADVFLNGNLIGSTPATWAFNTPLPTHVVATNQSLFHVGKNCIEVVVRNTHGVVTGLNIAGTVMAKNGLCCDDRGCRPRDDGQGCVSAPCPTDGHQCLPVCVRTDVDGTTRVIDCDCKSPNECHVEFGASSGPACVGGCPPGQTCIGLQSQNIDGSIDLCCVCVDDPPRGACCFSGPFTPFPAPGGCAELTQAECEQFGGLYLGDGTMCLGVQACCLKNGTCVDVDAICCDLVIGGVPYGPGSVCLGDADGDNRDDLCFPPQLSCCNAKTGQCLDLFPGHTLCPPGYTLVPGPCGNLQACCLPDGTCIDAYPACCKDIGGMPQGAGSNCANTICPPPTVCGPLPGTLQCQSVICPPGEECLPRCVKVESDTHLVLEVVDCDCVSPNFCHMEIDPAGFFQCVGGCPFAGQTCRTTVTPNPDGTDTVCCECVDLPPQISCCETLTGACFDLLPGDTQCPPGFTPVPGPCGGQQACCLPDGTCIDTFKPCCLDQGGMPQGAGTTCLTVQCGDPVDCEPPTGAINCNPVPCPTPGDECLPKCALVEAATQIVIQILDCKCQSPNFCHLEVDPLTGQFTCVGGCPTAGQICRTTVMDHADGTQTVCCDCVDDVPQQLSCCDNTTGQCFDLAPGVTICPQGQTLVPGPCGLPEACCLPDGTCADLYPPCCSAAGGTRQGPGSICATTQCGAQCLPVPGAPFCEPTTCPIVGQECLPRCVRVEPGTNIVLEVVDCDCVFPDECHLEVNAAGQFQCFAGLCPTPSEICRTTVTVNADGTETICCECVPDTPPDICPLGTQPGGQLCANQQPSQCTTTDPNRFCVPKLIIVDSGVPGGLFAELCGCGIQGQCGALIIDGDLARCPGQCPAGEPGPCQIYVNGDPIGTASIVWTNLLPGTTLSCDCGQ